MSRELFGRYYWVGGGTLGVSQSELEKRVSSLYSDGVITSNNELWAPLKARYVKAKYDKVIDFSVSPTNGYSLDKTGRKHFLVYHPENRAFYSFSFWNFRGIGKAHTPCDLLIERVTVLQPDSTLLELNWQATGPSLAVFKREVLPVIRKGVIE